VSPLGHPSVSRSLALAAAVELATGLALVIRPSFVTGLLFGGGVAGAGTELGRMAGLGLFCFGLACWPRRDTAPRASAAVRGLLTYNVLVLLYLACLGLAGKAAGPLLWPAVLLHAVLAGLLIAAWIAGRSVQS
jgi:hypothetical protein